MHNIISINLDGRVSNLVRIEAMIHIHQPLLVLLQDIPQLSIHNLNHICRTIAFNYEPILNKEHLRNNKKRNHLILVDKERLKVKLIHAYTEQSKASSMGVSVTHAQTDEQHDERHGDIIVFSIYIRPRATYRETRDCLEWIRERSKSNEGHSRTIIMGDVNASDASWCPISTIMSNKENSQYHYKQIKLVRGKAISKFMDKVKLTCLNRVSQGPTFQNRQSKAYIDVAFVGNKAVRMWSQLALGELSSQSAHKILILQSRGRGCVRYKYRTYKRIRADLLDSSFFVEAHLQCDALCTNWRHLPRQRIIKRMDRITNVLYGAIELAQEKITSVTTRRGPARGNNVFRGVLNARIRKRVKRLRRLESRVIKFRSRIMWARRRSLIQQQNRQPTGDHQRRSGVDNIYELTKLKKTAKARAAGLRRSIIDSVNIGSLNKMAYEMDGNDLWGRVRLIERRLNEVGGQIEYDNGSINSEEEIEALANEKFPHTKRDALNYVDTSYNKDPDAIKLRINDDEIYRAIADIENKTYNSSVGIKMRVFSKAIEFTFNIIKALMEMSFWACYIPKKARITQGTLIPKKAPGQFRIVHVSSPLAALLELVALRRLEHRLEDKRLNSPYQFGFSALISRHDLIARALEFFYKEYVQVGKKAAGLIVSLDIAGAFDNVNQDKLIMKMDRELGDDPLKYWLAEFVLHRQISVRKGKLKSHYRDICLGVPQGSALGPVLWNYMIHDLDQDLARPARTELIRYADDIILIYNGINRDRVQWTLNKLVEKLKSMDLSIRPEKCSVMGIKLSGHDHRLNAYHINGTRIQNVDNMSILGVPLTNKLKLNRKSREHREKLLNSVRKLHNINRLGFINSAKEWRILIESYIRSRLVLNSWPVLILDHNACKWVDDQMIRALRIIFQWPSNTSTKLIRLITGTLECNIDVMRIAKQRALLTEYSGIYNFLIKISPPSYLRHVIRTDGTEGTNRNPVFDRINLETDIIVRRKHPDPSKPVKISEVANFHDEIARNGPTWVLLDRNRGSMMAEIIPGRVISQYKIGRHTEYPISYFNSFSLLFKYVSDDTITNRSLTLGESNSMLSAIENVRNRDWRIILLRERLSENGWKLNRIRHSEEKRLRESLAVKYKGMRLRHGLGMIMSDFTLWLEFSEGLTEERVEAHDNLERTYTVEALDQPFLGDYKGRNHLNKRIPREDKLFYQRCHTSITRAIEPDEKIWQLITPNWLDGMKMLVLGGLTHNENGQLETGERLPSDQCRLCEGLNESGMLGTTADIWRDLDDNRIRTNQVLHKAFRCRALQSERSELVASLGISPSVVRDTGGRSIIGQILMDRRSCQKLLRFMVKCNLTNQV